MPSTRPRCWSWRLALTALHLELDENGENIGRVAGSLAGWFWGGKWGSSFAVAVTEKVPIFFEKGSHLKKMGTFSSFHRLE